MKMRHARERVFAVIALLCALSLAILAAQSYSYWRSRAEAARQVDARIEKETLIASEKIGARTDKIEAMARSLAVEASSRPMTENELSSRLVRALAENPELYDVGLAYEPAPFLSIRCVRDVKGQITSRSDSASDYTRDSWYAGVAGPAGRWTGTYRSKNARNLIVSYSAPFALDGRRGVIYASMLVSALRQPAGAFKFGNTGYCVILGRKGEFLYHPIKEAAEGQKTIFEIARSGKGVLKNKEFVESTKKALEGESVRFEVRNPVTNQLFSVSYKPIGKTGWALGAIFFKDEIFQGEDDFRKRKMWMILSAVIFLTLISALVFRASCPHYAGLWVVSGVFSLLCIAGTFYIWHLALQSPLVEEDKRTVFTDAPSLNRFIEDNTRFCADSERQAPSYIPTGIFIQTLEFANSNDLNVTGYIWQKYRDGVHDGLKQGFIMPEARNVQVKEAYRFREGDTETIGWYFEAVVRQTFDCSKYPFDRPDISIWIRSMDLEKNIILVPDLAAYKFLTPSAMPGLQEGLTFPGYVFLGAFFNYQYQIRRSNLGVGGEGQPDRMPEFYYNIVARRNFVTPFVSRLFPLFIMFAILFIVQLMFSSDEEKKKAFGLNAFAVMGVVITFFFSTMLSQNSLRQELNVDRIIFIENFHFIAYIMLLLATIKTLLFIGGKNIRFVHYKQGLIPKLLYWPFFTGMVFAVSFANFYR